MPKMNQELLSFERSEEKEYESIVSKPIYVTIPE